MHSSSCCLVLKMLEDIFHANTQPVSATTEEILKAEVQLVSEILKDVVLVEIHSYNPSQHMAI